MTRKERVIVYIDGSNLYFKLKTLSTPQTSQFNYYGLSKYLVKNGTLISIHYYVGVVRSNTNNHRSQKIEHRQYILFNTLHKQGIILHKGYLMKNNGVYHEKGVDVNIAVDLLIGAYEDHYDTALLLSSDTDLIPAIQKVKNLKKKVGYIGFVHHSSIALKTIALFSNYLQNKNYFLL